jgi:putative oxidoreductase
MSVLTVFRTHPLIHVSYLITLIPGIILVANGAVPITLLVVYAGVVAFEHSNTNLSYGPLNRILVSPNYHRIHHRLEGRQDVNLGFALTIWDQLSHRRVPDEGHDSNRHRPAGPAARRGTDGAAPTPLLGHGRPATRPIPAAERTPRGRQWAFGATRRHHAQGDRNQSRRYLMAPLSNAESPGRLRALLTMFFTTRPTEVSSDAALAAVRIALAWIFTYYGAGKLFGAFNGPGIHRTALYFSNAAHLHPGGFFAVLGGVIEFGGAVAMALGLGSRLAGAALFGDQVMAMITVTWTNGINSETLTPGYEFNMALAVLALVIVFLGPGRLSVDALIARRFFPSRASATKRGTSDGKDVGGR